MVPLSTFSCSNNVTFRRRATSTAVVVSELRQWDCQGFKFPDSRCRPFTPFQTAYILFNDVEGKSISCILKGREWPNLGVLAPRHTQRPQTYRHPFFPRPCQKKKKQNKTKKQQHSIHYSSSCRRKHFIGDVAMVIVKFRPRWPHTQRYALHSRPCRAPP